MLSLNQINQHNCRKCDYFNILAIFQRSSIVQFEAVALMVLKAVWQADVAQKSQQNSVKSVSFFVNLTPVFLHCLWQECLNFTVCRFFFSWKMGMKIRKNWHCRDASLVACFAYIIASIVNSNFYRNLRGSLRFFFNIY